MEFCKDRVFTAVNADELKPGDKVLTSNNIASLKEAVRLDVKPSVIVAIWGEMYGKRFKCKSTDTEYDAEYAYLVERAEKNKDCNHCPQAMLYENAFSVNTCEKHYQPFRDTDELIKVWREKSKQVHSEYSLTMPYIWVREKEYGITFLITGFADNRAFIDDDGYGMDELLEQYTFLDGSVCGVEE